MRRRVVQIAATMALATVASVVGVVGPTALPASAAVTRYVAPAGTGVACSPSVPCALADAVALSAVGDEVVLHSGEYTVSGFGVPGGVTVRGATPGAGRPVITSGSSITVIGVLRDVEVRLGDATLQLTQGGAGDRLLVSSSSDACRLNDGTLTNSLCRGLAGNGSAVVVSGARISTITNVTGVGSGTGWGIGVSGTAFANVSNSIALGGGGSSDLFASAGTNIVNSYYVNRGGRAPGSEVGRVSSGLSVDAAYRPVTGSTTVDVGFAGAASGARDLGYALRTYGANVDIGAYELAPAPQITAASSTSQGLNSFAVSVTLSSKGLPFTISLDYGTAPGVYTGSTTGSFGAGADIRSITSSINGLQTATTYYWRAVVTTDAGLAVSPEVETTTISRSTTTVSSSPNPSLTGQPYEVTATVLDDNGQPVTSGTVRFTWPGSGPQAPIALDARGRATMTTSSPSAGTVAYTATFGSNAAVASSTSAAYDHRVEQAVAGITLTSDVNPARPYDAVTYTATVTDPRGGAPAGTVEFTNSVGSVVITANGGVARTRQTHLFTGSDGFTATFTPTDPTLQGATSATLTQVWELGDTTTSVTSNRNPAQAGQDVTLTATVVDLDRPGSIPTGSVELFAGATSLGTAPLDGTGQARLTTSSLGVGNHDLTAVYLGSETLDGSTSAVLVQSVSLRPTSTSVISNADPSLVGDAVTISARVTDGASPARGGLVTFTDGGAPLGAPVVVAADGTARITTSALTVGEHPITATFSGTPTLATSSATVDQTVELRPSRVDVVSSDDPAPFADPVTFTGTVTDVATGALITAGTVYVDVAGTPVVTGLTPDANGEVEWSSSALPVGSHLVTFTYSGVTGVRAATTGTYLQTIDQAASTVGLSSSRDPSVLGDDVTFTATVDGPGGTPSGDVTFSAGGTPLATVAVDATGRATFTTSALGVGSHAIGAAYAGDGTYGDSTSAPLDQTVDRAGTTTSLATSGSPAYVGTTVTLTATVAATQAGPATGQVRFTDGLTVLGTVDLIGGQAVLPTSALALGDHAIAAEYLGSGDHTSSSANLTQRITKEPTSTTVTTTDDTTDVGAQVTFTATVSGDGRTPTGSVTFADGATVLGTVALSGGIATLTTSALAAGSRTITAAFAEGPTFLGSSGSVGQAVGPAATATAVTSDLDPSTYGATITITAAVSGNGPTPTGTVTFTEGATVLAADVPVVAGVATYATASLAGGAHTIDASYSGSSEHDASTGSIVQDVDPAATATTVTTSATPVAVFGTDVTFTATVAGPLTTPTGTVTFTDGAAVLGTVALAGGTAALTTASLAGGARTVTATYSGSADHAASSGTVDQPVAPATTETTVVVDPSPADIGDDIAIHADVRSPNTTPSAGTVTFRDGATVIGTAEVGANGRASITVRFTTPGARQIEAGYAGTADHAGSVGAATTFVQQADAGGPYVVAEGDALALDASASTFRPTEATVTWDLDGDGAFDDAEGADAVVTPDELTALGLGDGPLAPQSIAVRIVEDTATSEATSTVEVTNTPPTTSIAVPTETPVAGRAYTIKVGAEDPSSADMAGLFTYTVDWGDGTDPDVAEGPADPPFTHVWSLPGEYEVTAVAADADGVVGPATVLVITVEAAPVVVPPTIPSVPPTYTPPTTYTPPATSSGPLARTGTSLGPIAALGLLMAATGLALALGSRRPRRSRPSVL